MPNPKRTRIEEEDKTNGGVQVFMKRGNKRDAAWLAFIMFAVGVLFRGFHSDIGFWIAGGVGILVGFLAFILKVEVR